MPPETRDPSGSGRAVWPGQKAPWRQRLAFVVEMMREVSRQGDPQALVEAYGSRVQEMIGRDAYVSLSRRGLDPPRYRITRASRWDDDVDPWKQKDRLPLLSGGILGELLYGDEPRIINDFQADPADPAFEYLGGVRSLMALPQYEDGTAINMVVRMLGAPDGFDPERLPDMTQMATLFGRATKNLVLSRDLKAVNDALDREMRTIAEIQQSLLPRATPLVHGLSLGAYYQTSHVAGGDYYDFFGLPEGRLGILIADVSGHGAPAAVLMAILHALAHSLPEEPTHPSRTLDALNARLSERYTSDPASFVTAFYGIYDPPTRRVRYACAGHPPPLLARATDASCGACCVERLDKVGSLPLGVFAETRYEEAVVTLEPGDVLTLYTDGITEAGNGRGDQYGEERLRTLATRRRDSGREVLEAILEDLDAFTAGAVQADDRTLVVARVGEGK